MTSVPYYLLRDYEEDGAIGLEASVEEWVEKLVSVFAEVRRVLRSGGRLILIQPNYRLRPQQYFDDYTHVAVFTDRSLPDMLEANGFAREHVDARFLPLTLKSRLAFGHRLVPLYLRLPWRPLAGQMLVVATRR